MLCTVIMCTRNRAEQLRNALTALAGLKVPKGLKWEVVVVDNGSTDATPQVIESFAKAIPIRRVWQPVAGLSNARNAGVKAAKGKYILWTDDDAKVAPNWLKGYVEAFKEFPNASVFGGKVTPVLEEPQSLWLIEAMPYFLSCLAHRDFGQRPVLLSVPQNILPYGVNFAVRTAEQKRFLYDPELGVAPGRRMGGEETDVIHKILLQPGAEGRWVPESEVLHFIPPERQTYAYCFSYYESNGILKSFLDKRRGRKAFKICGIPWKICVKLPLFFLRYHVLRLMRLNIANKYLIPYADRYGAFMFWRKNATKA